MVSFLCLLNPPPFRQQNLIPCGYCSGSDWVSASEAHVASATVARIYTLAVATIRGERAVESVEDFIGSVRPNCFVCYLFCLLFV
jgi:hypothetical protein